MSHPQQEQEDIEIPTRVLSPPKLPLEVRMRINFSFPTAFVCLLVAMSTQPILSAQGNLDVALLKNVRPIGGSGNNLVHPNLDPVPGSAEINLAPPNFAPHTRNALIAGPNPREISNVIAGGTGAKGQNGDTEDPIASAWLYVFGQFVDHDLDLESTPANSAAINITVPQDDPFFPPNTTINMTRDARSRRTNTIINTVRVISTYLRYTVPLNQ